MFTEHIGKCSNKVKNIVERSAVKKFAEAIGDPNPIYWDEETGKKSRYKNNIAPPTFPRVFDYGVIDELKLPSKGLIHGEQIFHYERPLLVGEEIICYSKVEDYYEKKGSIGKLGFLVIKSYGEDPSGQIIFTSTQTIIITEAVRKAMIV
ncbi:MaoC family dehydratase N-terminal domain-containing protein [Thermaerobacillus caldiproteolyticus]|uniref:MaoC family dehydratase N-terminal domain-containing protein n=1 Tax=Thermaerobacillus caldiproteolyticus TaxID=247480 RepID=UPI00188B8D77|nr:MaoC family dehydratase N-terminal domain-containing protein [Anoxybacillus caldiproteolyticus]QPA32591.1 MaoC family dehydratase N-terminal domain-containing protein [Anoxybacillus caldiproteolyticus]